MEDWDPITSDGLRALLAEQSRSLRGSAAQAWCRYQCHLSPVQIVRSAQYGTESVFVIAKAGPAVLFFDDDEDEFAIGTLDSEGVVQDVGLVGELSSAISIFANNVERSQPPGPAAADKPRV